MKRIVNRIKQKPKIKLAYHLLVNLNELLAPPAKIAVQVIEVSLQDEEIISELGKIPPPYDYSKEQIIQFLQDGRRCYVALHNDQLTSCYWVLRKGFTRYRHFELADDEEYQLSVYTLPEFRGQGIMPYLVSESTQKRRQQNPDLFMSVDVLVINKAQLRSVEKQGFKRVGLIGFMGN